MNRRGLLGLIALFALVAVVAVGLTQSSPSPEDGGSAAPVAPSAGEVRGLLAGAPEPLAALHRQGNELIGDGAIAKRIKALEGTPIVINKWASWCGPCRAEFSTFRRVSAERGKEIAFLGLNSGDTDGEARAFLDRFPLSFPSYTDPASKAASKLGIATAFPMTVFYDRSGRQTYIHQGPYLDTESLEADIARYTADA